MICLTGTFDPISQQQVEYIRKLHQPVFIYIQPKGLISQKQRQKMLRKVLTKVIFLKKPKANMILLEPWDWVEHFDQVAYGIQQDVLQQTPYLRKIVERYVPHSRLPHVFSVANTCVTLAKMYGCDLIVAYQMGLLHDLTKHIPIKDNEQMMDRYYPALKRYDYPVWHSFTCVPFLKYRFHMQDRILLDAIYHHTLGSGKGIYAKILYIADKIEPTRGYDTRIAWQKCRLGIDIGFQYVKEESEKYRKKVEEKHG